MKSKYASYSMLGKHHTDKAKENISNAKRGKGLGVIGIWNKGRKYSEEHKNNIKENAKNNPNFGFKNRHHSKETIEIIRQKHLGKKPNENTKIKMSESHKGEKSYNWKGGASSINHLLRTSAKWQIWRNFVFLRDNFTCQNPNCEYCHNKIGAFLHPHHEKPVSLYPELAFDVNNGITYCKDFHLKSGLHREILKQEVKI